MTNHTPYQRWYRLVAIAIAAVALLSLVSSIILFFNSKPPSLGLSPDAVRLIIVTMLMVFGFILPMCGLFGIRMLSTKPVVGISIFSFAMFVNALSLNTSVSVPPTRVTSGAAAFVSGLLTLFFFTHLLDKLERPISNRTSLLDLNDSKKHQETQNND